MAETEPNSSFASRRMIATAEPNVGIITIGGSLSLPTLDADFTDPASLLPGGVVSHGYADLTPGMPYAAFIDNTSADFFGPDTMMRALDEFGNQIAFDDDGSRFGDGFASAFSSRVNSDGTINLEVTGYDDFEFSGNHFQAGDYTLYVQPNSLFESGDFGFSSIVSHYFEGLPAGIPYYAYIDNRGFFGETDTVMRALDPLGNEIAFNDDGSPLGGSFGSAFSSTVNSDGTIHLEVTGYPDYDFQGQHDEFGDYGLFVQLGQTGPGFTESGDIDFYSFTGLQPGSTFAVEVVDGQFDTMVHWLDNSGVTIDFDDDGGNDLLSRLPGIVPDSGVVNIAVTGYFDHLAEGQHAETGMYNLMLTHGSPSQWTAAGNGAWSDDVHWSDSLVPDGVNRQARFGPGIAGPAVVTIDADIAVSAIQFDNPVHSVTLADDGVHALSLAGAAVIDVAAGEHIIAAPLVGSDGLHKVGNGAIVLTADNAYQGPTIVSRGMLRVEGAHAGGGDYIINAGGTLAGSGMIQANVVVDGTVAPGSSPGILEIDGDYTQNWNGTLQIEIGGLTIGTQHDQLVVSGTALLAGVLEASIVSAPGQPPYVPALGDIVTVLTAGEGVEGWFDGVYSPNLHLANPELALRVITNPNDVQIEFVGPDSIEFADVNSTVEWADLQTVWLDGDVQRLPETVDVTFVSNQTADDSPQHIEVSTDDAFAHRLRIEDDAAEITVTVGDQRILSAVGGVSVGNHGVIELGEGQLVSPTIDIGSGGKLSGSGAIIGNVTVGATPGAEPARFSTALGSSAIDIFGDYQQVAGGELVIEIKPEDNPQPMDVAGELIPGGALTIMLPDDGSVQAGDVFELITASSLADGAEFDEVNTVGNEDLFIAVVYRTGSLAGPFLNDGSQELFGTIGADGEAFEEGDMNLMDGVNSGDIADFALALQRPGDYFALREASPDDAGDIDDNGRLDFDDIDDFAALVNMSVAELLAAMSIPEPNSACLALLALAMTAGWRQRLNVRRRLPV